jgi:hypothetical protein
MLLVLTSLLLQGSVRADTIPADEQMQMNRLTIGLLVRGQNINDVLDFVAALEECHYRGLRCPDVYPAARKVGLDTNNLDIDIVYAEAPVGTWSIYESFGGASGTISIELTLRSGFSCNCAFLATATFPGGGTAHFQIYDGPYPYPFQYTNDQGDFGSGYLTWSPTGCALVGPFTSSVFKGANGFYNSGILVLRRC